MNTVSPRFLPQEQPYRKVGLFCLFLLLLMAAMKAWMWYVPGAQLLSVQSGSMAPYIQKGDAIIVEPIRNKDIEAGDVISYHSPVDERLIITHRVQSYDSRIGQVVTKGDNAARADQPFGRGQVIGRVGQHWRGAGSLLDGLRSRFGLAALYVIALGLVLFETRRLMVYFRPAYRHASFDG